ncbi:retrotransposable element Tf2 [Tanacetum coccineum]
MVVVDIAWFTCYVTEIGSSSLYFGRNCSKKLKVSLQYSIAYHPQSDGQTEVAWLPLAEYWYNTNYHTSTKSTPFEILYGQPPAFHVPYIQGDSVNEAVERTLVAREVAIDVLKFHLERAQNRMKSFADKGRTDGKFKIGMWVYLKLQPHRQVSIRKGQQHKLSPKYYGPFKICGKVGNVAYKLELPNRKVAKEGNRVVVYLLVQWSNGDKDDATWEPYDSFIQRPATTYTLTASNVSECNKVVLMG